MARWLAALLVGAALAVEAGSCMPERDADGGPVAGDQCVSLLQTAVMVKVRASVQENATAVAQHSRAAELTAGARRHEASLDHHRFAAHARQRPPAERTRTVLNLLHAGQKDFSSSEGGGKLLILTSSVFFVLALAAFIYFILGRLVSSWVEGAVKTIGADIEIERRSTHIMPMRVELHGFKILNPKGHTYNGPYALNADKVVAYAAPWKILRSWGRHVDVDQLNLETIELMVEYDSYFFGGTSNLQRILDVMSGGEGARPSLRRRAAGSSSGASDGGKEQEGDITVRQVRLEDISAKIANKSMGFKAQVGDIVYADYSKEHDDTSADDLVWTILTRLQKSLLGTIRY